MTTTTVAPEGGKTPWHLWAVGVAGLLWNSFGAWDYTMTKIRGDAHLRDFGMTQAQIDYFHAMPGWMTAVWAIGVWGAIAGTVLLLIRSRFSLHVYVASFAAFLLSLVYTYLLSNGVEVMGSNWLMSVVIAAACAFFIWYAWVMTKRGVLR